MFLAESMVRAKNVLLAAITKEKGEIKKEIRLIPELLT